MVASSKLFGTKKLLEFEEEDKKLRKPSADFSPKRQIPKDMEYTVVSKVGSAVSVSGKMKQEFHALGYNDDKIRKTVEACKILNENAARSINPIVFAKIRKRYRARMNIMVALSALCKQDAADLGLILKSMVRFFKRNHFTEADLDEIERYVQWVVSRGDTIIGVPSSWEEYCALHKIRRKTRKKSKK
jgi:hypothetical protein